jgi:two-component system, LytTR family, sensor kinase
MAEMFERAGPFTRTVGLSKGHGGSINNPRERAQMPGSTALPHISAQIRYGRERMPEWVNIHEPVLVNTIGHCAGAVVFGMLLYLFLLDWRHGREDRGGLPVVAASLALLWNLGSLVALASGPKSGTAADIVVAGSFSVLSLLPAVLLHISLESRHRALWVSGYALSFAAVALHVAEVFRPAPRYHNAALLLVTIGFTALTVISVVLEWRRSNPAAGSRLAGAMGLFLFAISFLHFSSEHTGGGAWSREVALHHAGLPLALLVLLQGYRFLLLDAFLRFIVNASLTAAALLLSIRIVQAPQFIERLQRPFDAGVLFVSACLLLALFVHARNRIQSFLTRVIFLRANVDEALRELQQLARAAAGEADYLGHAAETIARFLRAARFDLAEKPVFDGPAPAAPTAVLDSTNWTVPSWVRAVLPLRFSRGDAHYLLLGSREGGRRYLSEDFGVLGQFGAVVVEHVEQLRGLQMQSLVSQAELRTLQAQINPHFLFNSLNTLYGTIDRSNPEARRLVLNLADVFRYLLRTDRTFIEIEEELSIVRAYLEIEELRLGPRLHSELAIDDSALHAAIPMLSIQPLVENAVKHGVAPRVGTGFVRLAIRAEAGEVFIEVVNSGEWHERSFGKTGGDNPGVGLSNVRRRLTLCYGAESRFAAHSAHGVTTVGFRVPLKPPVLQAASV